MDALSRYLQARPRTRGLWWFLVFAMTAITCGFGIGGYTQYRNAEIAVARSAELQAARAKTIAPTPTRTEQEEQKRWATLKAERDFAWEPLFRAIERAASVDIELLEFQPDKNNHRVTLRGEAKDSKALIAFLDALAAQAALENVHLVRREATARVGLEAVAFEIKATLVSN